MSSLLNHLESTQFSFKHWSYRENFPGGGQPVYEGNRPQYLGIYEVDSKSGHEPIQDFISRCITFIEEICIYLLQEARLEDASAEVARLKRWAEISVRGDQTKFSESIRQAYEGRCAVTACSTGRVLEAAHIRVDDDHAVDFSDITNGILLRADIHALFDAHLITLSADGTSLEISEGIDDPCYEFLKTVRVKRPPSGQAPSPENISHRRKRFLEAQKNP